MQHTIEKMDDEPIILVTIKGEFTVEHAIDMYSQSLSIKETITTHPVYRIIDVHEMEATFPTMMKLIRRARKNREGSPLDKDIQDIFVGRDKMALLARDAFAQDGVQIPVFTDMESALQAIRSGSL